MPWDTLWKRYVMIIEQAKLILMILVAMADWNFSCTLPLVESFTGLLGKKGGTLAVSNRLTSRTFTLAWNK